MDYLLLLLIFLFSTTIVSAIVAYIQVIRARKLRKLYYDLEDGMDTERGEFYDLLVKLTNEHIRTYARMKMIDEGGSFEADDEVGMAFTRINSAVKKLAALMSKLSEKLGLTFEGEDVLEEDNEVVETGREVTNG